MRPSLDLREFRQQLEALERKVLTGEVADPYRDRTALADTQRVEDTLLSAHLFLWAWATEQADPDQEHYALALDLLTTYAAHSPRSDQLLWQLTRYGAACGYPTAGVPLLGEELPHAAAQLRLWREAASGPLPAAFQEGGVADLLYRWPAAPHNPRDLPLEALMPPLPRAEARWPLHDRLSAEWTQASHDQRLLLLLLLTLNARDRLDNLPALSALQLAVQLGLLLEDEAREAREAQPLTPWLRRQTKSFHAELEGRRVPALRQGSVVRRDERPAVRAAAYAFLRTQRAHRAGLQEMAAYGGELLLLQFYERLDAELQTGVRPDDQPFLKAELLLSTMHALIRTHRSPQGALPVLVELAAQQGQLDPLWAWTLEPEDPRGFPFQKGVHLLFGALELLRHQHLPDWPSYAPRVAHLLSRLSGQMFAAARQLELPLPEEAFLRAYFAPYGTPLSRVLTSAELSRVQEDLAGLLKELVLKTQVSPLDEAVEASADGPPPPPEAPALAARPPSPYIEQARALLRGQRVVLIGGHPSGSHHAALVRSFELAELDWIDPADYAHGSHAAARLRPPTGLVIIALRWMGHAHSAIKEEAKAAGLPFVMHPSGLNPVAIAYQIITQVSGQLSQPPPLTLDKT